MAELTKATLVEISTEDRPKEVGQPVEVQFNPASLKLQISNSIEGDRSKGRQVRQYVGSSSSSLSMDLIFDTADQGTNSEPEPVTQRTALVERFVQPRPEEGKKQTVPKLRFQWGSLIFDGIVESISLDFDHFASNGVPLRAKVSLMIKEQDHGYQFLERGPGANAEGGAPPPGRPSPGAPGSAGLSLGARASLAIGGEASAEFAARVGLDPGAWRGLSIGASNSLSLDAGLEVGFSAGLSAGVGLGVTAGIEAGAGLSLDASFGLEANAGLSAVADVGVGAELSAGFALSSAGGVDAAINAVQIAQSHTAAQQAQEAFGTTAPLSSSAVSASAPAATAAAAGLGGTAQLAVSALSSPSGAVVPAGPVANRAAPAAPDQPRPPLAGTGLPTPAQQIRAAAAPPPPRVDPRAASFGFGVPLRPSRGGSAALEAGGFRPVTRARPAAQTGGPPTTELPTVPGWVALPARDPARRSVEKLRRGERDCGCRCEPGGSRK